LIRVTPPETFFKYVPNFSKPFEAHQDRIIAHYKKTYSEASGGDISMMLATDIGFWIPHIRLAEAQSKHARTYMYMFTWPSPALDGVMGSPHGIELPFVFDILKGEGAEFYLGKSAPKKLAESSNDAWINFARTGVPSASGFPEWPAYDTEKRATMIIDEKSTVVYDPKKSDRELFKGIIY
jgi:para-nitrobenzyl esterase